jgi:hypothetical protein
MSTKVCFSSQPYAALAAGLAPDSSWITLIIIESRGRINVGKELSKLLTGRSVNARQRAA